MSERVSGAFALAQGAIESGIALVTGYPGTPATAIFEAISRLASPDQVHVEWSSNEKVAIEVAFGASLGGRRALLCVKSVGLNIALDPLMTYNLSGCNAGLVVLVGDDPGGWGSQNEQDSRALAPLTELPWFEPTTVADARKVMRQAFVMSEEMSMPVVVRVTRSLVLAEAQIEKTLPGLLRLAPTSFQREFMRWVVLPINVVPLHHCLVQHLEAVRTRFEALTFNGVEGNGSLGVIAAGFAYQKLLDLLEGSVKGLRVLRLGTFHPLPAKQVVAFLLMVESALVLEETAPMVERAARATAQRAGLNTPIYGRDTGHVPLAGELFAPEITEALRRYAPRLNLAPAGAHERSRPSRDPLCEGCPYVSIFDTLTEIMNWRGGRDAFIVVGDPGCMVHAQMPPYELMDVKHSLGASIGMAAGIALSARLALQGAPPAWSEEMDRRIIALCGDSGFLHSGFSGLVDAARLGVSMMVLILDNGTTALSGGQPHPASPVGARGEPRRAVDLAALAREAGADVVLTVDLDEGGDVHAALKAGVDSEGLVVVIARGRCVIGPQ
jgi:indolepyruvate ferredoxin oxidoreductase alpha subunit